MSGPLPPEYFTATKVNLPALLAGAKVLQAAGYVLNRNRGNRAFDTGWPDLPNKPPIDIDRSFRSSNGECFNLGIVIAAEPQGDAPNMIIDVDLHGVQGQKDIDDCMAAKRQLVGDMPPTVITGGGGEHYHLRAPPAVINEVFARSNAFSVDWEGKAEGKPANPPPGEPPPRWKIEVFGPRHNVTAPPSIHPKSLKPYRWGSDPPRTRPAPYSLIVAMRAERPGSTKAWGPRRQLVAPLPPGAEFDPEVLLPDAFLDFCIDASRRRRSPIDYIAATVVAVLGSAIGAACTIRPKSNDDWDVAPNLWGALVGDPALCLKSPSLEAGTAPLSALINEEGQLFEERKLKCVVSQKAHAAKVKAAEAELKEAAKNQAKGDDGADEAVEAAVEALRRIEEKAPKPPVERRFVTNDPSVEKIGEIVRDNCPRGILYLRDELTGMMAQWERPDRIGEKSFYLEAHPGTQSFNTDRIGRGRVFIPVLNISLFGGIQPDMLAAYLEKIVNDLGNDGMLQRFQLLVFPKPVTWEWNNDPPNFVAYDRASHVFKKLATFNPEDWGATQRKDRDKFPWFSFGDEAQEVFIKWSYDLHTKRIPNEDNPLIRQHLAKYDKLFCSLALIFHLVDLSEGLAGKYVSEICALRAVEWCEYLESHARRCYALLGHNKFRHARLLGVKIERGELEDRFTARDVVHREWGAGLDSLEAVTGALEWLEVEGWVRGVREPPGQAGGRPTTRYELHPELKRSKS